MCRGAARGRLADLSLPWPEDAGVAGRLSAVSLVSPRRNPPTRTLPLQCTDLRAMGLFRMIPACPDPGSVLLPDGVKAAGDLPNCAQFTGSGFPRPRTHGWSASLEVPNVLRCLAELRPRCSCSLPQCQAV